MPVTTAIIQTPVGEMIAGAADNAICLFDFLHRRSLDTILQRSGIERQDADFGKGSHPLFGLLRGELEEYFAGSRKDFSLPLAPSGSDFQKKVWAALLHVPYGTTVTYTQQAKACGDEKAIRAIAAANGMNGLAILIPCHRVVGAGGALTGYSGGMSAKRWLLDHERRHGGKSVQQALF